MQHSCVWLSPTNKDNDMKKKLIHSVYAYGAHVAALPDGSTVWHSAPFCVVPTGYKM